MPKRMKGLEPSTFCMASRCSSQLSYIREGAQYSRGLRGAQFLSEQRHDVVGLRIAAEHRLREDELVVHVNVEDPVRARDDLDGADGVLPFLEDPRRQTGGVRERPSGNAVLDAYVTAVGHSHHSPMADQDMDRSSASFTRLSASSLCSRRTAV